MATLTEKCPNCGGSLKFNPSTQKSSCEFCRSDFTIEELEQAPAVDAAQTPSSEATAESTPSPEHLVGYTCNSCGAEVVTEETTTATFCYYCHQPVLLTHRLTGAYKPDKIIPFQYDRQKAIDQFLKWSRTRKFVPASFYSASQLDKITGLYLPYWMADYQAEVDYAGQATVRRSWVSGAMEYTEYKDYAIERQGTIEVDHLHDVALKKIDKQLIDSITPFNEQEAVDFNPSYLSGFLAEKYDIDAAVVKPTLETRAKAYVSTLLRDSMNRYGQIQEIRNQVDLRQTSWQFALFPAWILTYQYHGRTYIYAVNGQNGRAYGELPLDKKKLNLTSGVVAAIVLALALIGGLLLW